MRKTVRNFQTAKLEKYTPDRKAEFLLTNAVDLADYLSARKEVRKLGLDPDSVCHCPPIPIRPTD